MNYQSKPWKDLLRDQRAQLIASLYSRYKSVRKVAAVLGGISKSLVHRLLTYSKIPIQLRQKYSFLSLKSFVKAYRSGSNLEKELEKQKIIHDYNKKRRRIQGLEYRLKTVEKMIPDEIDKRKRHGLMNERASLLNRLNGCPP